MRKNVLKNDFSKYFLLRVYGVNAVEGFEFKQERSNLIIIKVSA